MGEFFVARRAHTRSRASMMRFPPYNPRYNRPLPPPHSCHRRQGLEMAAACRRDSGGAPPMKWWNGPEMKRRKRVAIYKLYSVEGRVKASIKRGFRWMKHTCQKIVHP